MPQAGNGELLTAITAAYVGGAKEITKQIGQGLEHHVAGLMAENIVEFLEVVEEKNGNGLLARRIPGEEGTIGRSPRCPAGSDY